MHRAAKVSLGLAAALLALVAGAVFVLSGTSKSCTAVGGDSSVAVTVDQVLLAQLGTGPAQAEVCLDGSCARSPLTDPADTRRLVPMTHVLVGLPPGEARVSVRVVKAGHPGAGPFEVTVQPATWRPNGPDCEPVVQLAALEVSPDGALALDSPQPPR